MTARGVGIMAKPIGRPVATAYPVGSGVSFSKARYPGRRALLVLYISIFTPSASMDISGGGENPSPPTALRPYPPSPTEGELFAPLV